MSIKVAIFNRKGGVGKTTLSIILTQIALMKNKKVLAVDQDTQNNFNFSISYLKNESNFKHLFTFKTSLTQQDFDAPVDLIIIDCPPSFNVNVKLALKYSDFILIPVRPESWSILQFTQIRMFAGDYKDLLQFPVVKVDFTEGSIHDKTQLAKRISREIQTRGYTVIGDLPVYSTIRNNIASDRRKWWSVGLQASAREPYEELYRKLERLYNKLQEKHRKKSHTDEYDYYEDKENPDIPFFGLRSPKQH